MAATNPTPNGRTEDRPTCTYCGTPILSISTRGPVEHYAAPCGHRVSTQTLRELEE